LPWAAALAEGLELTALVWTAPVEPVDVLPPPICTPPTVLDAVLLPEPATDVGAEIVVPADEEPAVAEGLTDVLPT
jgi:hypothetical protein